MLISELKNLQMKNIDRENSQIKVLEGKVSRDRFTLLTSVRLKKS
jgi:hypothetical protein